MSLIRNLTVVGAIAFAAVLSVGQALAQSTNIPTFDPAQHVYVDSALKADMNGFSLPANLESSFRATAAKQNMDAFIVFLQQGDETLPQGASWGFSKGDQIVSTWSRDSRFPTSKFELITCVHSKNPANKYAYNCGADIGSAVARFGVSDAQIHAAINNNFTSFVKLGLPAGSAPDWTGFATAVANSINNDIVAKVQVQPRPPVYGTPGVRPAPIPSGPSVFSTKIVFVPLWGWLLIVLFGGGGLITSFFLSKGARESYAAATKKTAPMTDTLDTQVKAFLVADGDMADGKLKYEAGSKSESTYNEGVTASQAYFKHSAPIVEQVKAIKAVVPTGVMALFAFWAWNKALGMVKKQQLTAESRNLTYDEVTSTSGMTETKKMTYDDLVTMTGTEYDKAKKAFSLLKTSASNAKTKKGTIEDLLNQVAGKKDEVAALGIAWDLFQASHADITTKLATVTAKLDPEQGEGDPIGADELADEQVARAQALLASITEAAEMQKHIGEVESVITAAHKKITDQRATPVNFLYVRKTAPENFRLDEDHGNPDAFLGEADKQFATLKADLIAGKVDAAETAKTAALAAANAASALIDTVLAAKTRVDNDGHKLTTAFYAGSGIEAIGKLYAAQKFVAAEVALSTFEAIAKAEVSHEEVAKLATDNSHLTSAATDKTCADATKALNDLTASVQAQVASGHVDWAQASQLAAAALGGFAGAAKAIHADVEAAQEAAEAVRDLHDAYNHAVPVVNNPVAAQAHRNDLTQVSQVLGQFDALIKEPKQSWAEVRDAARGNIDSVKTIQANAQHDIDQDAQYRRDLDDARNDMLIYANPGRYVMAFPNGTSYGLGVLAGTAQALLTYEAAQAAYQARNYAAMQSNLSLLDQELWIADQQARFAVLQSMALSGDPYGVAYARQAGYVDGVGYDSWAQARYGSNPDYSEPAPALPPTDDWHPNIEPAQTGNDGGDNLGGGGGWQPNAPQQDDTPAGGDDISTPAPDPDPPASDGGDNL